MKPEEGKIHRSCAVRCLSGGVPPVFVAQDGTFHVLLLQEDTPVSSLFGSAAQQTKIEGEIVVMDGKSYCKISNDGIRSLNNPILLDQLISLSIKLKNFKL